MATAPSRDPASRSASELVMDVADDLRLLIRKEVELARIELMEGIKAQLMGAGLIAAAAIALLPAVLFFLFALTFWLPFSDAASFAITGTVLLLIAGISILIGVRIMKSRRPKLDKSVASIKEDVRWAREQMTS
jgi:uncharacterized membrane protein YqjE